MAKNETSFGKFDFVGKVGLFAVISTVMVVVSLIYLAINGLNYGIDFAGGTELQIKFTQTVPIQDLRTHFTALNLKNFEIQQFGAESEYTIRFQTEAGKDEKETNEKLQSTIASVRSGLLEKFKDKGPEVLRVDSVGPQVGAELQRNGFLAVFYCLLVILIYVALRFDYKYSPGAVVCLFHDCVVTLGIFVLLGKEVNVPVLASLLTLIGYSLNDTIVVFDRIRETEGPYRSKGLGFVINKAINDMFERTLITSGTTLASAAALWAFAGGTVGDIAFVLTVGVFIGTYSSIYVAAPVMMIFDKFKIAKA